MRRFRRRKPSLIVLRLDDERTTVVERLQNFIRIRRNDAEAFDNDLVLVFVLPFPSVPDPSEGEKAIIRKRNCPWLAELLLFLLLGQWLPFEEEIGWDEATTMLPWLSPGAAALELVGARIDGTEIGLWRLRPVRHETPLHECQNTFARVAVEPHNRLNAFRGNVVGRREAGAVDLVILVVEHIGVVGMEPLCDPLLVRSPPVSPAHKPRLPPELSAHSIQNHSRQVHALGHHSCQTRRRPAYIRVPGQTNGRYDRGGNDQRRLHSRLLLHLLRPSLPLPRNSSLHFTHQCTTDRTGLGPSLYESFPRKISEGR